MRTVVRHRTAPNPYGCRWCGTDRGHHGARWVPAAGLHRWVEPTRAQMVARMTARRNARLAALETASGFRYHAARTWSGTPGNPEDEGYELCADCRTDSCPQFHRIQDRLLRSLYGPPKRTAGQGWGGGAPFPF
jgi:hypothetical protein